MYSSVMYDQLQGQQLIGEKARYKIDSSLCLGRGGFGKVLKAIARYSNNQIKTVAIKQFTKSDQWGKRVEFDKELLVIQKFKTEFSTNPLFLPIEQIFRNSKNNKYYMVCKICEGGTLSDRFRLFRENENKLRRFCLRLSEIINFLHYKLLQDYTQKNSTQDVKSPLGLLHRDIKPQNIVFQNTGNDPKCYLIDFGTATVTYINQKRPVTDCGTLLYKAPEINHQKIAKGESDIWSFGATLFFVLSDGEKMFSMLNIRKKKQKDLEEIVKQRLQYLSHILTSKGLDVYYWIKILKNCMQMSLDKRWNASQLMNHLKQNQPKQQRITNQLKVQLPNYIIANKLYEVNFEIFRIYFIYDKMLEMFENFHYENKKMSKFNFFVLIKYVSNFVYQKIVNVKDKLNTFRNLVKSNEKLYLMITDKYSYMKKRIDEHKFQYIRDKITSKIMLEINQKTFKNQEQSESQSQFSEIIERYPQIVSQSIKDCRKLFYQFVYRQKQEIISHESFANIIAQISQIIEDYQNYSVLKYDFKKYVGIENEKFNFKIVQAESMERIERFSEDMKSDFQRKAAKSLIDECNIESTVNIFANVNENQRQLEIIQN